MIALLYPANELVMIHPVDRDEGEREQVDEQDRGDRKQAFDAVCVGNLQLQHHDGDDDGQNTVGESFEAGSRK